jgi:hypothetical protein
MRVCSKRTWSAIISMVALGGTLTPAAATEKYWIAREAELVVVGTYHHRLAYPWIDGWHVSGRLDVDEVLFGGVLTHQIDYHLICRWSAGCRRWTAPPMAEWFGDRGIWFLRPVGSSSYGPPGNGGTDPGFRSIEQRADFERYILRYKR